MVWDSEMQTDDQIQARRPKVVFINKKKTCYTVDFAVPVEYTVKVKGVEKLDKYQNLSRGLKKQWKTKVTERTIVSEALGAISKNLDGLEARGKTETI